MSMYPKDDILLRLSDHVIEDHKRDACTVFEEKTARFSTHPAELMCDDPDHGKSSGEQTEQVVMLEKMGVSDPKSDKINGQMFTAAVLHNLYSHSGSHPDLVILQGSQAITEYHNPDLLVSMYPMLFPCGIGWFEDPQRPTTLSFEAQAHYYLELADWSFRYHHSYLFVALNMTQCWAAHLQTFFTVCKSNFDDVARKLTQVSLAVLDNLAY
ncbi:uncharacterized protein BJ212DRAFT_1489253 [Suillus subaureus]|uniref:Helitron helicase-like domain-containing protein n=1 Tax=Suillus subaureus TaxID=48587 RepID=A0A9P7AYI9_9AGAM|nr:uncharacterized protein BJ212DRAFT_1489253 [Suillus subaureus]KAG1796574.1 hypothetical protein BJ212DRAFT_1489253 [Suillus subaureus]